MNRLLSYLYPFFLAMYPILFLYVHNSEQVGLDKLVFPLVTVLFATALIWGITFFSSKDQIKAGLITSLFVVLFFSYGHNFDVFAGYGFAYVEHRYTFPTVLFIFGYLAYFIIKTRKQNLVARVAYFLAIVSVVLIVFNVSLLVVREFKMSGESVISCDQAVEGLQAGVESPDIYYIILDEYASLSTIKNIWGYDNSSFTNYLKDRGFYIAENSKSRYTDSYKSLAASLNMEYLNIDDESTIYQMITNNKVQSFLESTGYKTFYLGNWYDISRYKINTEYQYNYLVDTGINYADEFSMILINSSMLRPFSFLFNFSYEGTNTVRNSIDYTLNKLKQLPKKEGPKFVFAHILCPHPPFVFGRNGEEVNQANSNNWQHSRFYLDQYIYISNEITEVVEVLMSKSPIPPIIIIQSDHGPRKRESSKSEERFILPEEDMYKIFNAYYLPKKDFVLNNSEISDNISPVNSFRVLFNIYFGKDFELLNN